MKHFKQFLCLMMALLMIFLTFVACGEDPTEPAKNSDTTVADGTGTTVPSTNETTTPPMDETEPPVTEPPVTEPPVTEPPVTEPPVTEPPETVPPCEIHTFAAEKLCTEERVCTVCRETVPAGEHTYYDGPCTAERSCRNCEYVCPASAAHVFGAAFSCGTQKCENCSIAMYGRYCERDTMSSPCKICGLTPPSAIPFITIDGIAIKEFTIVTPADAPSDYGDYLSTALRHRLNMLHDANLISTTDDAEKSGPEIRIGKTNRTVGTVSEGQLLIQVTGGDMEILCEGLSAYEALLDWFFTTFSIQQSDGLVFAEGILLSESFATGEADASIGDVRIMYHNVLFMKDYSLRYSFFRSLYDYYMPDIIGMQETHGHYITNIGFFDNPNNLLLKQHLMTEGYAGISADRSMAVFYNQNTLERIADGFISTRGAYGTTWALFRHKATGKVFGFANSHFSANSTTNDDPVLGNEARINDAKSVVQAINAMITAARKANVENPESIPVIVGGDYNCRVIDDPIQTVIEPAQLTNVRDLIEDPKKLDDVATFGNSITLNETYDYHSFYTSVVNDGSRAIDHCYIYNSDAVTPEQYRVITRPLSAGCSDHHAHYVDITFK